MECGLLLKTRVSTFTRPVLHTAYLLVKPVVDQCGFWLSWLYVFGAYLLVSLISHKDTPFG